MSSKDKIDKHPELPSYLKPVKQLGRGAFGTVYLCEDERSGEQVAVKHCKDAVRQGKSILREVRLLARLHHENLLHLVDFPAVPSPDFSDVFLVLPYMPADLHKVIHGKQNLSDRHVQAITCQILRGLCFLHRAGVAHRDLKPANILLNSDCSLKICDFGLARGDMTLEEDGGEACGVLTEYVVTRWYRAPEVMLLPKQYSLALDMWSVGCILCEIIGRKVLFPGKNHVDMIKRITEVIGTPSESAVGWLPTKTDAHRFLFQVCPKSDPANLKELYPKADPECLDLVKLLLDWNPETRITAEDALAHAFLKSFHGKDVDKTPEVFDWSFDNFKRTSAALRERLYQECSRFHPEILERDKHLLDKAGASPRNVSPRNVSPRSSVSGYPSNNGKSQSERRSVTPTRVKPGSSTGERSTTPPRTSVSKDEKRGSERSVTPPRKDATPPRRSITPTRQSGTRSSVKDERDTTPSRRRWRDRITGEKRDSTPTKRDSTPTKRDTTPTRA
mmetsp:Transcript_40618/g.63577  ORF Transcript_40618/g.63577 Transcript_40618/m.63577 type:complete len:504 (-) Transcript_40618:75-1586(-)